MGFWGDFFGETDKILQSGTKAPSDISGAAKSGYLKSLLSNADKVKADTMSKNWEGIMDDAIAKNRTSKVQTAVKKWRFKQPIAKAPSPAEELGPDDIKKMMEE